MAEQLQVMLSACDHLARDRSSTISDVIVHTRLTIPPPPIPANERATINQSMLCAAPHSIEPTTNTTIEIYRIVCRAVGQRVVRAKAGAKRIAAPCVRAGPTPCRTAAGTRSA